jgi:hypothetical protein
MNNAPYLQRRYSLTQINAIIWLKEFLNEDKAHAKALLTKFLKKLIIQNLLIGASLYSLSAFVLTC